MGILDFTFVRTKYFWDLGLNLADEIFGTEGLEKPHFQIGPCLLLGVWYPEMLGKILLDSWKPAGII